MTNLLDIIGFQYTIDEPVSAIAELHGRRLWPDGAGVKDGMGSPV
jgi:hypothetical protein